MTSSWLWWAWITYQIKNSILCSLLWKAVMVKTRLEKSTNSVEASTVETVEIAERNQVAPPTLLSLFLGCIFEDFERRSSRGKWFSSWFLLGILVIKVSSQERSFVNLIWTMWNDAAVLCIDIKSNHHMIYSLQS